MKDYPIKYIVSVGDAFNGMTLYGPFKNHAAALDWCENEICGETWNIVELCSTQEK